MSTDQARRLRDLFEAAGELSAVDDEDAVLHTAIRKARQLIGTDLAYLMLFDRDRGDAFMRVAEGAISPLFDTIRLGMGLGLGGQVAQSMSPRWTRNYLEDEQYTHVIDPIIIDEGLRAILGVPVKKHGRLTGVLFTSDRSERDFTQEDISILALLADHLSTAIEAAERAADRFAELDAARSALRDERALTRRLSAATGLHDALTRLVVEGAPVPAIVQQLVDLTGGCSAVFDTTGRQIGDARADSGPDPAVLRDVLGDRAEDPDGTVTVTTGDHVVVVTPVVTGADHLGVVAHAAHSVGPSPDQPTDRSSVLAPDLAPDLAIGPVLEQVAAVIALILLGHRARDEADNRVRGELLAELLAPGDHDFEAISRRATLLGVDVDTDLVALSVTPAEDPVSRALHVECSALARSDGGLVTAYGDRVVMLLPGSDAGGAARTLAARLTVHGVTVGASGPVGSVRSTAHHVERARRAAGLLVALDRSGDGAATEELGVYGLLFSEVGHDAVAGFIERNVEPIAEYDRSRGTDLLDTARTWFATEGSASATASRLFVHVNTVYQRLDRLDSLLGTRWRSGDDAMELRLALRLWELRGA